MWSLWGKWGNLHSLLEGNSGTCNSTILPSFEIHNFRCLCWIQKVLTEVCCCCCYVASVVSDSVRPHRRQPTRLPHPWDSQGKNTGEGCHFLLQWEVIKSWKQLKVRFHGANEILRPKFWKWASGRGSTLWTLNILFVTERAKREAQKRGILTE